MGDNGAGKSTLVKIIAGNYPPSAGTIALEGRKVAFHKPADARGAGIEIVYQDLALCDNLTRGRERVPRARADARLRPVQGPELPRACSSAPASCSPS